MFPGPIGDVLFVRHAISGIEISCDTFRAARSTSCLYTNATTARSFSLEMCNGLTVTSAIDAIAHTCNDRFMPRRTVRARLERTALSYRLVSASAHSANHGPGARLHAKIPTRFRSMS
eukprot:1136497-Rhodomonas_salina.2